MLGRDLHVEVVVAAVRVAILDAEVREMDLVVEVREVVLVRPLADLISSAIGMAVVVVAVSVARVQPSLVLALELVVENDPPDVRPAFVKPFRLALVGAVDLHVVLTFPLASEAVVERLAGVVVSIAMLLEDAPACLRQRDRVVAGARNANRVDQALFPEMPQVTTGDHAERADCRQRPRLGTAERIVAIAVPDDLTLDSARQVDVPGEHVTWVDVALLAVAIALGPAQIVTRMMAMPIRLRLPRVVSRSAAELPRIVVAVARLGLPPVVIAIERIVLV